MPYFSKYTLANFSQNEALIKQGNFILQTQDLKNNSTTYLLFHSIPDGGDAHLHRHINHEHKEAEQLNALREATGRIPGGKAVPDIRRDGERGRFFNESQSQDYSNG